MYLIKTPLLLKKLYPNSLIWNKSRADKSIFLTFDDGPIPIVTPWVLKTLKNFNAKATFFCIGQNINKNKDIFLQLKADGHAIGNHTYNHLRGWDTRDNDYLDNFKQCQQLTQTNLFRPPYGRIKKSQIRMIVNGEWGMVNGEEGMVNSEKGNLEQESKTQIEEQSVLNLTSCVSHLKNNMPLLKTKIIMWDVLSGDFDINLSPEKCLKNVLKHTENGSIVVFHDSLKAWDRLSYTLPKALAYWTKEGYTFKTL